MEYSSDKIREALFVFKKKTGLEPTVMYVGRDTRDQLVSDLRNRGHFMVRSGQLVYFMNMVVMSVYKDEYLEFGVTHDVQ